MLRDSSMSADATLKYFALGAVATAFLFFGLFLHIVAYGSVDYSTIGFFISRAYIKQSTFASLTTVHYAAFFCVITTFLFKLGVYPYHFYLADVYESVRFETLILITIPVKFVTYFAMLNYMDTLGHLSTILQPFFVFIGLGSVLTGSYGAFKQQRLRSF